MSKCFITKLPSSVDNDNLPVLGQLKINWLKQSNLADNAARAIRLYTNDSITVKVSGAHFTDNTLTNNLGNTKTITSADVDVWLYVSNNSDAVLTIDNKYSLTSLSFEMPGKAEVDRQVYFDIKDIEYCTNINDIDLYFTKASGDISALSKFTNLSSLISPFTRISGDISALSNLTNLNVINLAWTNVNGDISALSNLTNLNVINLAWTNVNGDISALSNLTNLNIINLDWTNVSGDIASLVNLTKLNILSLNGTSLTGDMSKIPASVKVINQRNRKINTNFTWTANGRKNATFLAMQGNIPFDTASMDNMLIDQATCTLNASGQKILEVYGTRTSASDAAVTAIQNKGVTITGVTKA